MHGRVIFFDVGCNNGAFSARLLELRLKHQVVIDDLYLFEPNPRFDRELQLLASRGAMHVRKAAWIADGSKSFFFSRNDEGSSLVASAGQNPAAAPLPTSPSPPILPLHLYK